jgi:serine/threonine protein kinase
MFPVERVPEKIGAYSVVKYVGRSGMADLYVARMDGPLDFSRVVSLKIVRFVLEDDARLAEELAREASICARLNHPAVLRMFDFFEYERKLVLVLEQAEGATLEKLTSSLARRKQKLGDNAIMCIGVELAQALAHAHNSVDDDGNASPVLHRNVQPENVLISFDGRVKLGGFGLGKILGHTPDSVAGTITGTPGFMAPEQARGEHATVRSDVYALGAVLWSLFADSPLPADGSRPPSISTIRPDIPREIAGAIDAALEPIADKRRITALEFAQWTSKLMNPEKGREELRQKAIGLRSARDAMDAPRAPAPRPPQQRPRRRQQVAQARASLRRSALVTSSYPAPPSSRAPRDQGDFEDEETLGGEAGLRLPPPPPLPKDRYEAEKRALKARGSEPAPHYRSGSQPAGRILTGTGSQPIRFGSEPAPSRRGSEPVPSRRNGTSPPKLPSVPAPTVAAPANTAVTVRPVSVIPPSSSRPRSGRPGYGSFEAPTASYTTAQLTGREELAEGAIPAPVFGPPPMRADESVLGEHPSPMAAEPTPTGIALNGSAEERVGYKVRGLEVGKRSRQSMIVPALTALLVIALGALVLQWKSPQSNTAQAAPTVATRPAADTPPPTTAAPPADAAVHGAPTGTATATAPATAVPADGLDPLSLTPDLGYLTVKNPENVDVYVNGRRVGPTNQPGIAQCGQRFLHLAMPNGGSWLGRGQTIFVQCRASTVISVEISPDPPAPVHFMPARGPVSPTSL